MTTPTVTYVDGDEASGMAHMLGGLLEDNLRDYPSRSRVAGLARGDAVLTASDRDISVTLSFRGHEVAIANGAAENAPVLAGPWLDMAKLCSGQVSPVKAIVSRDLTITPRGRLDTVAAAGYVLSVPASFYADAETTGRNRNRAIAIIAVLVALFVAHRWARRRRSRRRSSARR